MTKGAIGSWSERKPRAPLNDDERILSGVLRHVRESAEADAPLPGEHRLAELLGCTRQQIRHALTQLESQGIVIRRQGASTMVDPLALRLSARFDARVEYGDVLARMGYTPSVEVISASFEPMPEDIAPLLTPDVEPVTARIVLRWFADERPAMIGTYTVPFPAGTERPFIDPTRSVFEIANDLWSEAIAWEVVTAGVTALSEEQAPLLEQPVGGVAKMWQIVGVTLSGKRIYHAHEVHHPDLVTYSFVRTVKEPWNVTWR
ncbi:MULTISPECIES: GntR family transcriptional regulator [Microbacterium]|uniref:GntR family transcriptional regulator n=1 Tax=Microbacterium resistens TaxID=156977 RepID=A0ABY3RNP1_9MICO|nr:GntR family transcriptional regulator [Microbacterium resistens]MBW1638336.1 GntR family transcriptional regulator [Microbacterium resistens]MDA4894589.1 GntR family transcriptional regulator [Streptomyces sp. MS2A]UGS25472.1 GntR family transcriptional regulator [Microbacterium resistens]